MPPYGSRKQYSILRCSTFFRSRLEELKSPDKDSAGPVREATVDRVLRESAALQKAGTVRAAAVSDCAEVHA